MTYPTTPEPTPDLKQFDLCAGLFVGFCLGLLTSLVVHMASDFLL